ncbi:hypothetical protein BH11PLA2_BH11PLA2_44410 [soil metagenome]
MIRVRPRIGIHCPGTGTGGPWRYVHSLLKAIDIEAFDVTVICDLEGEYVPRPAITVANLSAERDQPAVEIAGGSNPQRKSIRSFVPQQARVALGFRNAAKQLAARLKPLTLDLFHTQNTGCEEAPYAAKLAGIPHIVGTFHTDWTYDLQGKRNGPGYRLLETLSNRSLHAAIAVSDATARNWQRRTPLPAGRVVTIHNGIDTTAFQRKQSRGDACRRLKLPPDAFVVAGLGRLDEAKGFADLIDAIALVHRDIPTLKVVVAGDGPLRQPLKYQAFQRGLADVVTFLGFVSDVQTVLDAADAFALPSLCEACPYAVLEAMAAGLPVLGSNVGGVAELVAHNDTGFVLPSQSPPQWGEALKLLATRPDLRERLGLAGRERVQERFTETAMTRATFAVYRRLLD